MKKEEIPLQHFSVWAVVQQSPFIISKAQYHMTKQSWAPCHVLVKLQRHSDSRLSSVLFHSISSLIQTNPCPFLHMSLQLCFFFFHELLSLYILQQISVIWPLIIFTNLHISTVYFNTLRTGPPRIPFRLVMLTVQVLLNAGGGGGMSREDLYRRGFYVN